MTQYNDYPFYKCAEQADEILAKGGTVFQKFTCEQCGSRQTMGEPNRFFTKGTCEECRHTTDLEVRGCNYMAVYGKLTLVPE